MTGGGTHKPPEKVVCVSLSKALRESGLPPHMHAAVMAFIERATRNVSEAVCLTSMLASYYLMKKLRAAEALPSALSNKLQSFFYAVVQTVTSLNGNVEVVDSAGTSEEALVIKRELAVLRDLLFGSTGAAVDGDDVNRIVYPTRDLLTNIFLSQTVRLATGMTNLYTTTLHKRQGRCLSMQIDVLLTDVTFPKAGKAALIEHCINTINGTKYTPRMDIPVAYQTAVTPIIQQHRARLAGFRLALGLQRQLEEELELLKAHRTEAGLSGISVTKPMRHDIVMFMLDTIQGLHRSLPDRLNGADVAIRTIALAIIKNRDPGADLTHLAQSITDDQGSSRKRPKTTQKKNGVTRARRPVAEELRLDEEQVVAEWNIAFGLHLVIPYFHYMWNTVQRRRSFPVCPQLQRKVHFIDLSALGLMELVSNVDAQLTKQKHPPPTSHRASTLEVKSAVSDKKEVTKTLREHLEVVIPKGQSQNTFYTKNAATILQRLFRFPRKPGKRTWVVPALTNGRQLLLHYTYGALYQSPAEKAAVKKEAKRKRKDGEKKIINIDELDRGVVHYDREVLIEPHHSMNKFGIAVDPGHVNVIVAHRPFDPPDLKAVEQQILDNNARLGVEGLGQHGRRRFAKLLKQHEADESIYTLSNGHWKELSGVKKARQKREGWRRVDGLLDLDHRLSMRPKPRALERKLDNDRDVEIKSGGAARSAVDGVLPPDAETIRKNTFDPNEYQSYCRIVIQHWMLLFDHAFQPRERKLRFATYQTKQAAFKQVAVALAGSKRLDQCYLIWGDGSFGPTSRGHESAPNKGLYKGLSQYMPVVISSEWGTSKHSFCCGREVKHPKQSEYRCDRNRLSPEAKARLGPRTVRGLSICPCGKWWSRDVSAAKCIGKAFHHHVQTKAWLYRTATATASSEAAAVPTSQSGTELKRFPARRQCTPSV